VPASKSHITQHGGRDALSRDAIEPQPRSIASCQSVNKRIVAVDPRTDVFAANRFERAIRAASADDSNDFTHPFKLPQKKATRLATANIYSY
jgi:hypothetical protein